MWYRFRPYVSAAQRRVQVARRTAQLAKQGRVLSPVHAERKIAKTFWGQAWCKHLESYSDFSNRLPRGRTYVRNGSVLDLQIQPGVIEALVQGSELYTIKIQIAALPGNVWAEIKKRCAGEIGTVLELLQGKLSNSAMAIITRSEGGMFPSPKQITMACSCPDIAGLCKHLAAVLYGVGSRLDTQPELLFKLRQVNHMDLVPTADTVAALADTQSSSRQTLAATELADVFGVEMDSGSADRQAGTGAGVAKAEVSPQGVGAAARPLRKKARSREAGAKTKNTAPATATRGKKKAVSHRAGSAVAARRRGPSAKKGRR